MGSIFEVELDTAAYYEIVLRAANDLYLQGGADLRRGLKSFDENWSNIRVSQARMAAYTETSTEAARLCSSYPYVGEMLVYLRLQPRDRIQWGESALVASRRVNDREQEAAHLHKLAMAYLDRGDARRAIDYLAPAVTINREINRSVYEAADLGGLGLAYAALGDHRTAIKYYGQALKVYRKIDTIDARWGEGIYLSNLGDSYTGLGKPRAAIRLHEKALAINRNLKDRRSEGYAIGNLGRAYAALGEHTRALELFAQNVEIGHDMADPQSEGYGLFGVSLARWELGDRPGAVTNAQKALKLLEQVEDVWVSKVREQLHRWTLRDTSQSTMEETVSAS
jgi:tetratricopeptide (TPR) repeat protein